MSPVHFMFCVFPAKQNVLQFAPYFLLFQPCGRSSSDFFSIVSLINWCFLRSPRLLFPAIRKIINTFANLTLMNQIDYWAPTLPSCIHLLIFLSSGCDFISSIFLSFNLPYQFCFKSFIGHHPFPTVLTFWIFELHAEISNLMASTHHSSFFRYFSPIPDCKDLFNFKYLR